MTNKGLAVATAALVMAVAVVNGVTAGQAQAATGCAAARQQLGGGCGTVAFAHRGANGDKVDENTKKALEAAYAKHAHMETDVWLTQDHRFLIIHEDTLDRTTNCEGNVADWTMADIRDQCRTEPNGQALPSFNRFVKVLSHNPGQLMLVDVKGGGWDDDDNKALERLVGAASQAGVLERVYFADDDGTGIIETLRDVAPAARTAWKQADDEKITPKRARELSVDAVAARPRQWTSRAKVHSFQSKGFLAWSLLVNDKPAWKALIRRGVTGVLTDEPVGFRKVCAEMAS